MNQNKFGELVFSESDVYDLLMQGKRVDELSGMIVDESIQIQTWPDIIDTRPEFLSPTGSEVSVSDFHAGQQTRWHMPEQYRDFDIAEHVLGLCVNQAELQRCGSELLLFQEKGLFDLLRYLKYMVDVMTQNKIIWGVGRGSSVASFVLYKLGVHKIDSLYYNLSIEEFLR